MPKSDPSVSFEHRTLSINRGTPCAEKKNMFNREARASTEMFFNIYGDTHTHKFHENSMSIPWVNRMFQTPPFFFWAEPAGQNPFLRVCCQNPFLWVWPWITMHQVPAFGDLENSHEGTHVFTRECLIGICFNRIVCYRNCMVRNVIPEVNVYFPWREFETSPSTLTTIHFWY